MAMPVPATATATRSAWHRRGRDLEGRPGAPKLDTGRLVGPRRQGREQVVAALHGLAFDRQDRVAHFDASLGRGAVVAERDHQQGSLAFGVVGQSRRRKAHPQEAGATVTALAQASDGLVDVGGGHGGPSAYEAMRVDADQRAARIEQGPAGAAARELSVHLDVGAHAGPKARAPAAGDTGDHAEVGLDGRATLAEGED